MTTPRFGFFAALLVLLPIMLGGCASFQGGPPRPEAAPALATLDADYANALDNYHAATDSNAKARVRDHYIERRVAVTDRLHAGFRASLYTQRVGSAVGVDLATLGLNLIGVVSSVESAKTAANALSATLIGGKASVDKHVFFDRTLPALLSQMEAQRNVVRLRLLTGLSVPPLQYPLMQAAADLEEYYAAGTLAGAVTAITQQASTKEASSAAELARLLPSPEQMIERFRRQGFEVERAGPADVAQTTFLACLRPGGVRHPGNEALLADWMKGKGLDPAPPFGMADFLALPAFAARRAEAAADSTLTSKFKDCK